MAEAGLRPRKPLGLLEMISLAWGRQSGGRLTERSGKTCQRGMCGRTWENKWARKEAWLDEHVSL